MLTLSRVTKTFAGRTLFAESSLQVNRGDRVGLVGPNGAGKTTLFSLILGENEPDEGTVSLQKNATLGFLPQESAPVENESVLEVALGVSPAMVEVLRILREQRLHGDDHSGDHHDAIGRFTELDGHSLEAKAKRILSGLAFRESDFDRPARTMSGGWVMRAHLARLLVSEPDLLMLDEPTNHLDLEALGWFQDYLKSYPGAILMISHDREFLNALCGSIVELAQRRLIRYRGNYDDYVREKAAREEQLISAYRNQQKEIESLQRFADRFRAKASKASQAQSKLKQIERMEKIEAPVSDQQHVSFRFPQPARSGQRVITMRDIHHAYGENVVYRGIDFEAERGQRTVLVGPNGAGKSTLLKLLAGVLPVQQGTREPGYNARIGYYAQYRIEMLNPKHSVLDAAMDIEVPVPEVTARTVLGSFLFKGDDVFKSVSVLSGGEKSRLALVKLLLNPPNLLLMDEPTTHLDIASIDALVGALSQYEGTLIFISHDVYFIRAIATTVLHIHSGQLTPYAGNYQYYLDKSKASSERAALTAGGSMRSSRGADEPEGENEKVSLKDIREQRRLESEQRQARARIRREHERRATALEKEIAALEQRQHDLVLELENPETYASGNRAVQLNEELRKTAEAIARLTSEWEAAAESAAATD